MTGWAVSGLSATLPSSVSAPRCHLLPRGEKGSRCASRAQAFPRPQADPAGVVACKGQRSAARRWFGIRFRELRTRRGWIEPPSARPVALRQRRFESSGPRFCHTSLCSRRGLASSSRRGRSASRSVPEASRERGATLARRRRTHPAKRHASGRPPLGDGMRGIIREVGTAGIRFWSVLVRSGNRDAEPLSRMGEGQG